MHEYFTPFYVLRQSVSHHFFANHHNFSCFLAIFHLDILQKHGIMEPSIEYRLIQSGGGTGPMKPGNLQRCQFPWLFLAEDEGMYFTAFMGGFLMNF